MIELIDELKNLAEINKEYFLASILAYVAAAYEDGKLKELAAVVNDFGQKRKHEITQEIALIENNTDFPNEL